MVKRFISIVLVLVLFMNLTVYAQIGTNVNDELVDFTVETYSKEKFTLSSFRDKKVVILNFWGEGIKDSDNKLINIAKAFFPEEEEEDDEDDYDEYDPNNTHKVEEEKEKTNAYLIEADDLQKIHKNYGNEVEVIALFKNLPNLKTTSFDNSFTYSFGGSEFIFGLKLGQRDLTMEELKKFIKLYIKENKYDFNIGIDNVNTNSSLIYINDLFKYNEPPFSVVINKKGVITDILVGYLPDEGENYKKYEKAIEKALKSTDEPAQGKQETKQETKETQEKQININILDPYTDDTETSLPYELLFNIKDKTSAISAIKTAAEQMSLEQKKSDTGIDKITAFAEEAIAQASFKSIDTDEFTIDNKTVQNLNSIANSTKIEAQKVLSDAGISLTREISKYIKLMTPDSSSINVKYDNIPANLDLDFIKIENASFGLSLPKQMLAEANSVKIESKNASYSVNFAVNPSSNATVLVKQIKGNPVYQVASNAQGTLFGGKFNTATQQFEFKTRESGSYFIKNNEKEFADILTKSPEMKTAIKVLASKGIVGGTTDTTFSPDSPISRAEISAFVIRAIFKMEKNIDGGFSDVNKSDWYFDVAASAKKHKVMSGYPDNTFKPTLTIPKDQILVIAANTLKNEMKYKEPANSNDFLNYADKERLNTTPCKWQ